MTIHISPKSPVVKSIRRFSSWNKVKNTFFEKHGENEVARLVPGLFLLFKKDKIGKIKW